MNHKQLKRALQNPQFRAAYAALNRAGDALDAARAAAGEILNDDGQVLVRACPATPEQDAAIRAAFAAFGDAEQKLIGEAKKQHLDGYVLGAS